MPPHFARFMLSALLLMPAHAQAAPEVKKPIIWSYMGGGNDDEGWGTLSAEFATCDLGHNQSPVAIGDLKTSAMAPLNIQYRRAAVTMEKKDRTLVISMKGSGAIEDHGHRYVLEEMRIHTPAEHVVIGKILPAELHLIHRDAEGKMLILGIAMDFADKGTPALQAILDKAPRTTKKKVRVTIDPNELLPEKRGYYAYSGSLSWPPCTEGVEWRLFKETAALSKEQMKALGALLGRNARLLQPTYLRTIKETIN